MRKLFAFMVAAVFSFGMVGCGEKPKDAPKAPDAPKADAPKTDAPKTDAPKADAPKTEEKK
jgi:hypothetical protein